MAEVFGREAELAAVRELSVSAATGLAVLQIEGEPGIGKTTGSKVDATALGSVRQVRRRRGGGSFRLTPSGASGAKRALVALVEQNGLPRKRMVLDRFRAGPPSIGRAHRIRARLSRRGKLTLSWGRAKGAEAYAVGVDLSDGRGLALHPRGAARKARISRVARGTRVTVRVIGTRSDGARHGRAATRTFRPR
jgi:hypothetical protein